MVDGLFVPTTLAHAGATFDWETTTLVTTQANTLVTSMISEVVAI